MAGYVKLWTTLRNNAAFLSLHGNARSVYLQVILAAKGQRDEGTVCYRNVAALGSDCGYDRRTADKMLTILSQACLLTFEKGDNGVLTITLPKYKHWQEITVSEVQKRGRNNVTKIPPTRPDQTRPDQTRPDHIAPSATGSVKKKKEKKETDPRIKVFIDYWFEDYGKIFPGEKYVVQGSKEAMAVKRLLGSASLEDMKSAASWFLRLKADSDRDFLGNLSKEICLFVMKYNEIRQRMRTPKKHPLTSEKDYGPAGGRPF